VRRRNDNFFKALAAKTYHEACPVFRQIPLPSFMSWETPFRTGVLSFVTVCDAFVKARKKKKGGKRVRKKEDLLSHNSAAFIFYISLMGGWR